jgi:glutamate carboxypeptidase
MRAFSIDIYDQALQKLCALSEDSQISTADGSFQCKVEIAIEKKTAPWQSNPDTDNLFSIWQEAGQSLGMNVIREQRGGLSDGNYTWNHIPTIDGLGPDGGNAHCSEDDPENGKEQEFVRISSLVPKAILNTIAIQSLLQES